MAWKESIGAVIHKLQSDDNGLSCALGVYVVCGEVIVFAYNNITYYITLLK